MAEIADDGGGHKKGGKKRAKKQSTKIDMTPMVDLGFLLLTFFVLTSTFSKPKSMEISFPAPPPPNEKPVEVKNGLNIILTKDHKIFYYKGQYNAPGNPQGKPATELTETTFSPEGLHKIILEMNSYAHDEIAKLEGKVKSKQMADSKSAKNTNTVRMRIKVAVIFLPSTGVAGAADDFRTEAGIA